MNTQQRAEALMRLARCTREVVDEDTVALYLEKTQGFNDATFLRACAELENRATWFPKVAELRAACVAEQPQARPVQRLSVPQLTKEQSEFWLAKIRAAAGIKTRKVQP